MLLWRWWGCPRQWFVFFYWNVDVLTNQRRTRVRRVGNTFINHALHAQAAGRRRGRRRRGRGQVAVTGIEQGHSTATAQEIENQNAMTFPSKRIQEGNGRERREGKGSWRTVVCLLKSVSLGEWPVVTQFIEHSMAVSLIYAWPGLHLDDTL